MNIAAIIVAAGSGKRFGSKKQFEFIGKKRIFETTLSKFSNIREIKNIVIVLPEDDIANISQMYKFAGSISIVAGGNTRQDSVFNGLSAIPKNTDIVIIHDGVRPFVSEETIKSGIAAAKKYDSAVTAVPANDTVKISKNGYAVSTPDRKNVFLAQTPQVFKYSLIMKAYKNAFKKKIFATDDSALVEKLGKKVKIVEGSYSNIKITTKEDLGKIQVGK